MSSLFDIERSCSVVLMKDNPATAYTVTELVTPDQAIKYLELNRCNRPISKPHVDMLRREMVDNKFHHTHQGIAFDTDGNLIDGQHRLSAIVASGAPQIMQVTRGVHSEAKNAIDVQQRIRSVSDALKIGGDDKATHAFVAAARLWSHLLGGPKKMTVHEVESFIKKHRDSLIFGVCLAERGSGSTRHSVFATMLAVGHEAGFEQDMIDWMKVVDTGLCVEKWDLSALRLRDYWMTNRHRSRGADGRMELVRKISASMVAFVERRSLDKLYATSEIKWLYRGDR